jgi:alpha-ketoglutarate-dependent taurine dioxygenase
MKYSQIKDKFFSDGFVHVNNGKDCFDVDAVDEILDLFGKTLIVGKHHAEGDKRLQVVSESHMFGADDLGWHTDQSYSPGNYNGTILAFGDADHDTYTEFADMGKSYSILPSHILEYYSTIKCSYGIPHKLDDLISPAQKRLIERNKAEWPLVIVHPITGRKSLYFSPITLTDTNKPLMVDALINHCEKFTFRHHWSPGDIVLWDNRRVMHRRPAFTGHRELFRSCFTYE